MVKNNHQLIELEAVLLNQDFLIGDKIELLNHYKAIAAMYAKVEGAIAVLSDLAGGKSYIYYGALAERLGLEAHTTEQIDSILEEEIYNHIHPDDLTERNIQELQFFMLLKKTPIEHRHNYSTFSTIRMRDVNGNYIAILHRTIYLRSQENGSLWLALCLYNFSFMEDVPQSFVGSIQDCSTGKFYKQEGSNVTILSQREIEVLRLIESGELSKEIAVRLGLSINTINRHRQNIIEKLRVNSSIEAIKKAKELKIL